MININGKDWFDLTPSDVQAILNEQDTNESFFFEFKDDRVTTKKLIEEVSAFANTFGGYIFLGISDDKEILGCSDWDEQRIHTTIHDSITPIPSFDIKKFTYDSIIIYVIKIDEGIEPPYITSNGKIYERISSGSFVVNNSTRLSQMYVKREQLLENMEKQITIPPVSSNANNIYGYIDTGFTLVTKNIQRTYEIFDNIDLTLIAKELKEEIGTFSISHIGNSIIFINGGLSTDNGKIPAHTNNFLEIMPDGSAKMRIILSNNNPDDSSVNMIYAQILLNHYQHVYMTIMNKIFPDNMVYAKKYESLTVFRQFYPVVLYDVSSLENNSDLQEKNSKIVKSLRECRKVMGKETVVSDDRIPKCGLYTIDKRQMEKWGVSYTTESIVNELFYSKFVLLGSFPLLKIENDDTSN